MTPLAALLAHFTPAELPGTLAIFLLGALLTILYREADPPSARLGRRQLAVVHLLAVLVLPLLLTAIAGDAARLPAWLKLAVDFALLASAAILLRAVTMPAGPDRLRRLIWRDSRLLRAVSAPTDPGPTGFQRFPGL